MEGQNTSTFRKYGLSHEASRSLSLVYTDSSGNQRSLNIVCKDVSQTKLWVNGLRTLTAKWSQLATSSPGGVLAKGVE
ncbi:hypothetical protein CYMTET_17962, partial [Cymbomonas tetramitiformis]